MTGKLLINNLHVRRLPELKRCISMSSSVNNKDSWLNKLLVRKIEPTKESHSRLLSDKEIIFELQTDNCRPGTVDQYLHNYENYVKAVSEKHLPVELCGSWTVGVGDQDQCLHLWRYDGGYPTIDKISREFRKDPDISSLVKERSLLLRQRVNQYLLAFSFWPPVTTRQPENIYEIRSYFLKPGTMIEWGNNWAKAIQYRKANDEAFGGFFSQVGRLYNVHHVWCFGNMSKRKEAREGAWRKPGWDEVVAYTVPLIQEYQTRILHPNSFSPTHDVTPISQFLSDVCIHYFQIGSSTFLSLLMKVYEVPLCPATSQTSTPIDVASLDITVPRSITASHVSFCRGYESLNARKISRENAWHNPGWDEVVAYTVPLIREMHTRFLFANEFSPSK